MVTLSFENKICTQIPHLRRYARSLCADVVEAEDLLQDCLERALRKRHLWRSGGSLRSWLFRILYNLYLNQRLSARARWETTATDAGEAISVAAQQESHVQYCDALSVIDCLPAEQRAVLMLVVLEGVSYKEAAVILNINIGTLRSRLSRAREAVRLQCDAGHVKSEVAVQTDSEAVNGREGEGRLRRVK